MMIKKKIGLKCLQAHRVWRFQGGTGCGGENSSCRHQPLGALGGSLTITRSNALIWALFFAVLISLSVKAGTSNAQFNLHHDAPKTFCKTLKVPQMSRSSQVHSWPPLGSRCKTKSLKWEFVWEFVITFKIVLLRLEVGAHRSHRARSVPQVAGSQMPHVLSPTGRVAPGHKLGRRPWEALITSSQEVPGAPDTNC